MMKNINIGSSSIVHVPFLIILSSPSGAGKTTIAKQLMSIYDNLKLSVSFTTRSPRQNETDGKDYFFISPDEFQIKENNNEFLEHAKVHNNYYATSSNQIETYLSEGYNVLFDIDWQGMIQIKESGKYPTLSIFLLPPSQKDLKIRLEKRAADSAEVLENRMKTAIDEEIPKESLYDYVLINDNLDETVSKVQMIINTEMLKREKQDSKSFTDFINHLTKRDE